MYNGFMTETNSTSFTKRFAVLWPILAGVCWGSCGIFIRGLDRFGLDNLTIVFIRSLVGCILSLLFLLIFNPKSIRINPKDIPLFLFVTLIGAFGFMIVYNLAVVELSLSLTTVLLSTAPVFVLLVSAVIFHERITLKKVICMIMAFVGCAMLSGIMDPGAGIQYSKFGLMMGVLTALCNGMYILTSKKVMSKGYSPFTVCFWAFLFTAIALIPFANWHDLAGFLVAGPVRFPVHGPVGAIVYLLAMSIGTSLLPSVAYMYGMKYVDAGKVAILEAGAEPAAALLAGLILYSELPSMLGFAGMIISVAAVMLLAKE